MLRGVVTVAVLCAVVVRVHALWEPSADVLNSAAGFTIKYDSSPVMDPRLCTGRFTEGGKKLAAYLKANFRGITSVGGYNCRANTANTEKMSLHGTGRALDIMIRPVGGKANHAVGTT